jgi:hypothetical protein
MLKKSICLNLLLISAVSLFSQEKLVQAIKTYQPPAINGNLDDEAWKNVPELTGFIQNFPNTGEPASQKTAVKILYDNTAIYIAAYLYDDPALIRKQLTARDEEQQKDIDFFSIFLDTYHDQQNGFQFLVTSSNVQTDAKLSPAVTPYAGVYGDKSWDAVWDSKVSIKEDGWVVEMKIPFISLRFAKNNVQDWGLQLLRSVRRNNETSFWHPVDPQVNGFVNQFGLLKNLLDIKPPLRLSFSPYVSTGIRSIPDGSTFKNETLGSGGMDVKYGINESFTLDATLIPDFGQVISDNIVNNLTPYEVKLEDNRPFFTEGTEIFNKAGLFYSRRVGAMPTGYYNVKEMVDADPNLELIKNPGRAQLYNALKFSGRTQKKLGIGIFNAVGAPMYASVQDKTSGERTKLLTEPLTNYNIFVLDQALNGPSYVTFTNTNVIRNGMAADANVSGLDFNLYDKKNKFNLLGFGHYSKIFATNTYDGYNTRLRMGKVSGKFIYNVQNEIWSERYDPTDLGYIQTANRNQTTVNLAYREFTPTKNFISYSYAVTAQYTRLIKPDKFNMFVVQAAGWWTFKNFWETTLSAGYLPDQLDYFVIGSPFTKYARRPQYGFANLYGNTDSRKKLLFSYNLLLGDFFKNPEKEYYLLEGGVRYRFGNKLSMELSYKNEAETDYIISYGRDVLGEPRIAFVDFKEAIALFSGIYNFTPRINLTLRVRHYWSHLPVKRIAYLDNKGYPVTPAASNQVININYFNLDAFFTWDFRYGSRLILGYKNWLGEDESAAIDGIANQRYQRNLTKSFDLPHANELTLRFIYFIDYNQLRRKR